MDVAYRMDYARTAVVRLGKWLDEPVLNFPNLPEQLGYAAAVALYMLFPVRQYVSRSPYKSSVVVHRDSSFEIHFASV